MKISVSMYWFHSVDSEIGSFKEGFCLVDKQKRNLLQNRRSKFELGCVRRGPTICRIFPVCSVCPGRDTRLFSFFLVTNVNCSRKF